MSVSLLQFTNDLKVIVSQTQGLKKKKRKEKHRGRQPSKKE
jgi:hypothetical protein